MKNEDACLPLELRVYVVDLDNCRMYVDLYCYCKPSLATSAYVVDESGGTSDKGR